MKVLHLTKTLSGGAGMAAARTVAALRQSGLEATLWSEGNPPVLAPGAGTWRRWFLDKLDSVPTRLHLRRRKFAAWSNNWRATRIAPVINAAGADIVHLHSVGQGFLALAELRAVRASIVWTMHDAWPFTGGCHYPADCLRYRSGCGCCPQLASAKTGDLSRRNWFTKQAAAARVSRWISPSAWLADCAASSGLVPQERLRVIPNAIDGTDWSPVDRREARGALALPDDALVLVAGAMDLREPRKGCQLLPKALGGLVTGGKRPVILLLFGHSRVGHRSDWFLETRHLGPVKTARDMARIFSAADALLMPSLQDNLPNVVMEAQACGCPVVGFRSGGISEIVQDGRTGLLTAVMTAVALSETLRQWLQIAPPREEVVRRCRERQQVLYAPAVHATALQHLYEEALAAPSPPG